MNLQRDRADAETSQATSVLSRILARGDGGDPDQVANEILQVLRARGWAPTVERAAPRRAAVVPAAEVEEWREARRRLASRAAGQ